MVQRDGYYPFGLTFNHWAISPENKYKFQGQEHQDETGWDQFKWRNHQPDIGRFFNLDPLAEDYYYNSPYAFSENKLISYRKLEGLEAELAIAGTGGNDGDDDPVFRSRARKLSNKTGATYGETSTGAGLLGIFKDATNAEGSPQQSLGLLCRVTTITLAFGPIDSDNKVQIN